MGGKLEPGAGYALGLLTFLSCNLTASSIQNFLYDDDHQISRNDIVPGGEIVAIKQGESCDTRFLQ
jgi:hypothetical protein